MTKRTAGSRTKRFLQMVGLAFNDDGTWGPLRLESARGAEVVRREKAREARSAQPREAPDIQNGNE